MSGRYGLRSKEGHNTPSASSAGVFKSPSKILADDLSKLTFGQEEQPDRKLRSDFTKGRKSVAPSKENIAAKAFGGAMTRANFDKTPSPPREEPKIPTTTESRPASSRLKVAPKTISALHTRPESSGQRVTSPISVPKDSTKKILDTPAVDEEVGRSYHDAMLPSFTSFGRRKTNTATATSRRAKKLILDAANDKKDLDVKDMEVMEQSKSEVKPAVAKLPPIDLSWLNVDDLSDLIVPELTNRRLVSDQLMRRYRNEFGKWVVQLLSGFNLLMHGLGSKRELLQEFSSSKLVLGGFNVIELDGFRPDFSFSDFVKELFFNYCGQSSDLKLSDVEMISRIEEFLIIDQNHLVLLVHSIDGADIRGNRKFHSTLAALAKLERVHVIASADHVNFPLMWDTAIVENFNWIYIETPTFEPPVFESRLNDCSLLRSILRAHSNTGAHVTLTSVRHVVFSLTPNAIKLFILICYIFVEKQARRAAAKKAKRGRSKKDASVEEDQNDLDNISAADLLLPLSVLYKHCRDQFIVPSYEMLLKHLRELFDHTLAKQVKHPDDGVDCLQMNMTGELASSFLDECKSGEYAQFLETLSTDIAL